MSQGQAARSPEGLGGWPRLDWGLCNPGVSWWGWGSMFSADRRVRLIFFPTYVGHSAGWCLVFRLHAITGVSHPSSWADAEFGGHSITWGIAEGFGVRLLFLTLEQGQALAESLLQVH